MKPTKPGIFTPKPSAQVAQAFEKSREDRARKGLKEGSRKEAARGRRGKK